MYSSYCFAISFLSFSIMSLINGFGSLFSFRCSCLSLWATASAIWLYVILFPFVLAVSLCFSAILIWLILRLLSMDILWKRVRLFLR